MVPTVIMFLYRWGCKYRISRPIRRTVIFSLKILEKKKMMNVYFNFSNLLEERLYTLTRCQEFHYLTIKMLYNRCTGIYKFGNNTYPRRIRRRSNLGHIFPGKKCVLWAGKCGISCVFVFKQLIHMSLSFLNTEQFWLILWVFCNVSGIGNDLWHM
jgi:hypothetical protein